MRADHTIVIKLACTTHSLYTVQTVQALVDHGTCQPTAEANASISDIPNPPNPTINLTFPELPDSPAATSGPGADDPGTTAPGSFTSRDAVDSVIITPAPPGSNTEARGAAATISSTDVTVRCLQR